MADPVLEVGLKPTLVLQFSMAKDFIRAGKQPETQVLLKQLENEWPEFKHSQWELIWYRENYFSIQFKIKLELASGVAEKVNDVYMYATEIKLCVRKSDGSETVEIDESLVELSRQSNYEHTLSTQFNSINCDSVSITVQLVMLKRTLNIIDEVKVPPLSLGNDLRNLLTFETEENNNKFTDVKISITSASESSSTSPANFFAHKAILAARSPVFAKMFEHNLQESATNCVTLSDIDPEVLKELLTYIYTDEVPHIPMLATLRLSAAEKYQLGRLKAMCEWQLSYDLEVDNAAETLVLAHTYGAVQLKKNALMYVIKHHNEVRETKDWEKVHNECELLEELLDTALELAA